MKISHIFQTAVSGLFLYFLVAPVVAVELSDTSGPTITVDELSDLPDNDLEDGECITSDGGCSLRAAIQESNLDIDRVRLIQLPAGTITITSNEDENVPDLGAAGDYEISSSVVIQGSPVNAQGELQTALAGNNFSRVFDILRNNTQTTEALIKDVVLQDGPGLHDGGLPTNNGSIIFSRGKLTLDNVTIIRSGSESNAIFNEGGELEFLNSQKLGNGRAISTEFGSVTISNSRFEAGDMKAGGAALLNKGATVGIFNSVFDSNGTSAESSTSGLGGAIQNLEGVLLIESSRFNSNQGILGGAIYSAGTLIIKNDVRFSGNIADRTEAQAPNAPRVSDGGAVYLVEGLAFIRDAEFTGNRAERSGGAIFVASAAEAQLLRLNINSNSALLSGGGVHFESSDTGSNLSQSQVAGNTIGDVTNGSGGGLFLAGGVTVKHCLIAENAAITGAGVSATGDGNTIENSTIVANTTFLVTQSEGAVFGPAGGVLFDTSDAAHTLTMTHVTLAGNTSKKETASGLVVETGKVVLKNSIVLLPSDDSFLCSGNVESMGNNVSGDATCHFTASGDKPNESDEFVLALNDNGGSTRTNLLPTGSVAIDLVPGNECLDTDQRLFSRDISDRCDAGAFDTDGLQTSAGILNFLISVADGGFPRSESDGDVSLTVEREGGSIGAVTVQVIDLLAGDASPGIDYEFESQTLSWTDGDSEPKSFTIKILDDTNKESESHEEVVFALVNLTGTAQIGERDLTTLRILENDTTAFGEYRLAKSAYDVVEVRRDDAPDTGDSGQEVSSASSILIEIQRIGAADEGGTFRYKTIDGTAEAGKDYTAVDSLVTFNPDESSKLIQIDILDDDDDEEDETFFFEISNDPGLTPVFFSAPIKATVTIDSEDITPPEPEPPVLDRTREATGAVNPLGLMFLWGILGLRIRSRRCLFEKK